MSSGSFTQQPQVQAILNHCRRQIRNNALLAGASSVSLVAVSGLMFAAGLDYLLPLPGTIRAFLLITLVVAIGYVTYRTLFQPLRSRISEQQLGAAVDLSAPEMQESLATLISIEGPEATRSEAGSDVMRHHLQQQVARQISVAVPAEVVDLTTTRKHCGMAGLVLCIALVPVVLWPSISGLLLNRLVSPFQNLSTVSNLYFTVADANRTVARDSDVQIEAFPHWRATGNAELPESVHLILIPEVGSSEQLPMRYDESRSAYVAVLPALAASVDFQISSPEVTTETFHLNVVDRPAIQTAVMTETPPIYTGRVTRRFDGMLGDMEVFEGSQLEIQLTFNKPVTAAALVWLGRDAVPVDEAELEEIQHDAMTGEEVMILDQDPDAPVAPQVIDVEALPTQQIGELSPDGTSARFLFTADAGGDFEFEIRDEFDLTSIVTTSRHLTVIYDQAPQLTVGGIKDGERFRPDDIVPLNCLATDDIGLGELQLHYRIGDDVERIVPARDFEPGSLIAQSGFRIPLTDLEVKDGDVLLLKIKASDERPDPGPQVTWSDILSITVDSSAAAAGTEGLKEDTANMIAALRQLEQLLLEDEQKGWELRNQIRQEFSDERRTETDRLSEKEQQQGRILEQLAEQVASHPLMQESAEKLQQLSRNLRQDIPDTLDEATRNERQAASQKVEEATKQIQQTRNQLASEINRIEETARLEQELAELNRLALQAEQLSKDSEQLDSDRRSEDAQPDELTQQQWEQDLQNRQAALQQKQRDLTQDIEQLLEQQQELRKAAQNAQKQQLMDLADEVQKLAEQQTAVAQGTQDEARETGRDAQEIAKELEKVVQDTEKLNQQLDQIDEQEQKADTKRLQQAAQQLRKGNLEDPRQDVSEVAAETRQLQQQLNSEQSQQNAGHPDPASDATPGSTGKPEQKSDQSEGGTNNAEPEKQNQSEQKAGDTADASQMDQRQQAAGRAEEIEQKLNQIEERIQQLQSEKNLKPSAANAQLPLPGANQNGDPSAAPQANAEQEASQPGDEQPGDEQPNGAQPEQTNGGKQPANEDSNGEVGQVQNLLSQLRKAADSVQDLSDAADNDPRAGGDTRKAARESAERAENGLQQAAGGRFNKAAQELSRASAAAQSAGRQMNNEAQQQQQQQAESLGQDLGRLAEQMQGMQQDDASQIAAQQQTQAGVSEQAAELPKRLQELQESLEIPALQMQDQANRTRQATQAAEKAADNSQQASENLQSGNLQEASQEGQETAKQLRQVANATRQAGQQQAQQASPVPNEVGQSVADALQQLQQAAEAMQQAPMAEPGQQPAEGQQSSDQQASGQPSSQQGTPGQPQAGKNDPSQPGQPAAKPGDQGKPSPSDSAGGQPSANGPAQSGSQPLSDAAQSLAEAARQALPGQHRPSDPSNNNSHASSDAGNGSGALWNGLMPNASAAAGTARNWGQLVDELDTNTSEAMGTSRDTEYEALIRLYFREVARATEKGK